MAYNVACYYVQNCLGVGTDTPSGRLEVVPESIGGNEGIFVNQLCSHQSTIRFKSAHSVNSDYRIGASILVGSAFEIYSVNANASRLVVTCTGNVGIGTTAPNAKLQIIGDAGASINASVRIQSTNSTAKSTRLQLETYDNLLSDGLIDFVHTAATAADHRLSLGVNTPSLHILGNSNVGIGTTSPAKSLHVVGTGLFSCGIQTCGAYGLTDTDFGVVPFDLPITTKNVFKFYAKGERVN
jgi:hypothetical protein